MGRASRRQRQRQRRARMASVLHAHQREAEANSQQGQVDGILVPPTSVDLGRDGQDHMTNVKNVLTNVTQSKKQRSAEKARVIAAQPVDDRVVACVVNLPYSATPSDILMLLRSCVTIKDDVVGCMIKRGKNGRPSGQAHVVLKSISALDQLQLQAHRSLTLGHRHLKVYRQMGAAVAGILKATMHTTSHLVKLKCVRKGNCVASTTTNVPETFVQRWLTSKQVTLDVTRLGLGVEFDDDGHTLRFEFDVVSTGGHVALVDGTNDIVTLRFTFRRPPRCVRLSGDVWVPTIDVTWEGALGWCSMVECVLSKSTTSKTQIENLRVDLRAVGITLEVCKVEEQITVIEKLVEFVSPRRKPKPLMAWESYELMGSIVPDCGFRRHASARLDYEYSWDFVFDRVFASLPFCIRYLMHALRAKNRLRFARVQEAEQLATALTQALHDESHAMVSNVSICDLLRDLHAAPAFYKPVEALIDQLKRLGRQQFELSYHQNVTDDSDEDDDDDDDQPFVPVYAVMVTPLHVHPLLPVLEGANRILRLYRHIHDRFIRVAFVDERFGSVNNCKSGDVINLRVARIMEKGLYVAGRKFVFLA